MAHSTYVPTDAEILGAMRRNWQSQNRVKRWLQFLTASRRSHGDYGDRLYRLRQDGALTHRGIPAVNIATGTLDGQPWVGRMDPVWTAEYLASLEAKS